MGSNYKILNSLDLSRNDLLNVSRILGYELSTLGNDLEITTSDNTASGNTIIRSGVGTSSGKVHLLAGVIPSWSNGKVSDNVNLRGGISRGIILNPDSSISIVSDNSSVVLDAKTSITLRSSSSTSSSTPSDKTSITLTSSNDKITIKDKDLEVTSSGSTTFSTTNLTTITSDKFKVSSTSGNYILDVNSSTKPTTTINGATLSYNSLLKIEAIDVAEKINAQKDVEIAGNFKIRNTSSSFSKDILIESNEYHLKSNDILEEYQENTPTEIHYKLESNLNTHKLIIDDIQINNNTDIDNLDIKGNFSVSNTENEYVKIKTPEYSSEVNTLNIKAGGETPTLIINSNSTSSNINVDYTVIDEKLEVGGADKTTEENPALDVRGALTVGKNTYLEGDLRFNTSKGLITNDNASSQITIEETNIKLDSTNTTIKGSQIDVLSSDNLNLTAYGTNADLVIKTGKDSSSVAGLSIVANSTSSSIIVDDLSVRGSQTFTGTTLNVEASNNINLESAKVSIKGSSNITVDGPASGGLSISSDTSSSSIKVKNLTVSTSAGIQALSVTGNSTFTGIVNINGNLNLTGDGLITSTATTKNIQIQASNILDIRRTSAGSTSNSIIYANPSSTYINASHINLSTDLNFGSNKVRLTTSSASIVIPTTISVTSSSNALTLNNTSSGKALLATGNIDINSAGSYTTTVNGSTVNVGTKGSAVNIGTSSSTLDIKGSNNLIINSNNTTGRSFVQVTDAKITSTLTLNEYSIYYDSNTNSIVFAQGSV